MPTTITGVRHILALAVSCIFLFSNSQSIFVSAQQNQFLTEREILSLLYTTCAGSQWTNSDNWLDDTTSICDWYGITCANVEQQDGRRDSEDNQEGRQAPLSVTEIVLQDNNMDCVLPPEVFYLPHLRTLDLGYNPGVDVDFTTISGPAGFELKYLRLNDCGLTSLAGIENAAGINLVSLDVGRNAIVGDFPSKVMQYKRLRNLDLTRNFLEGTLPSKLGTNLFRLRSLLLGDNFFSAQIPSSIGNATKLQILDLSDNGFTSTLPSALGQLKKLMLLTVRNQRLVDEGITGPLFDFKGLKKIEYLDLSGNGLSGTVPDSFLAGAKTNSAFMSIDISGNRLGGTLPPSLSRFKMLRFYLIDNMIDDIAPELCGQEGWFFGEVRQFGCNAILCPRGTYNMWGRQISESFPCLPCPGGAPNLGSTVCVVEEQEEDTVDIIGRGNDERGSSSIPSNSLPSNDEKVSAAAVSDLHDVLNDRVSPLDPQDTPYVRDARSWLPDNSYLNTQRASKESESEYNFVENKHRAGATRRGLRARQ